MMGHQVLEYSPYFIIGILIIQSHDAYALTDPGPTLWYITPYVAFEFGIEMK